MMTTHTSRLLSSLAMSIRQLAPANLASFLDDHPDAVLLDVREPWEHQMAAIAASVLIPLGQLADRAEDELGAPGVPVVVYCHHGVRSMQACAFLASLGFTDLLNLSGGIDRYSHEVDSSVPVY